MSDFLNKDTSPSSISLWRGPVVQIGTLFVITRLILLALGYVAETQLLTSHKPGIWQVNAAGRIQSLKDSEPVSTAVNGRFWPVDLLCRRDSGWYLDIAERGYSRATNDQHQCNAAFFPLYPTLISLPSTLFGGGELTTLFAGIVVANASLLVGLVYLTALIRMDFDSGVAARAATYVLAFPTTIFLSAIYAESLFFVVSTAAFYYARKNKWLTAALAASMATLTRPPGFLLFLVLLLEYGYQRDYAWKRLRWDVAYLALIPLSLLAHFSFLRWKVGSFFAFQESQRAWGRSMFTGGDSQLLPTQVAAGDICMALLAVSSLVLGWRLLRPSYRWYVALSLLLAWSSGSLLSTGRFCAVLFPLFLLLAIAGRAHLFDRAWLTASSSLAALNMILFVSWRYIG